MKIGHPGEDSMHATAKHLNYIVKGNLDVCEDYTMEKKNQKLLHKVAEERNLKPAEMIYLYLSSQRKPGYGGYKNWILIQESDTKQEWYLFKKAK